VDEIAFYFDPTRKGFIQDHQVRLHTNAPARRPFFTPGEVMAIFLNRLDIQPLDYSLASASLAFSTP
jgi:hypothetical protein